MGGRDHADQTSCDRTQHFSWLRILSDCAVLEIFQTAGGEGFLYRDANKSLTRPGRKKVRVTEVFDVHLSYL